MPHTENSENNGAIMCIPGVLCRIVWIQPRTGSYAPENKLIFSFLLLSIARSQTIFVDHISDISSYFGYTTAEVLVLQMVENSTIKR